MTRNRLLKTSFTAGELSPRMFGRGDMAAYTNGAARLRNVFIHPTGGISRRPGLRHIDTARGPGRLVGFEFNTEQVYLLVFTDLHLDVYRDGVAVADVATPWSESDLDQLSWTQSADTLLLVHPDHVPQKLTRTSHTDWTLADWAFVTESDAVRIPFHKFYDPDVTVGASATTGTVTLTASTDVFDDGHIGHRFRLQEKQVEVTAVASPTSATAVVKETLLGAGQTKDWEEAAFSPVRGWPVTVAFHQDRLVIGGSRDLPNRLWLSKSSDFFNFDLAEGLDDEAIEFPIVSDQVNAIRAVFSGRHLQVFTSGAEWMVTGEPLTPENVQLHRQTRVGAPVDRALAPRDVDGATVFVARNGRELREFLFTDVEQAYQATDLAMLSQHVMTGAIDLEYDPARRMCHVVLADGNLATVTLFRAERVSGWALATTDGTFRAIAGVGEDIYVLVERAGTVFIECFDDTLNTDAAATATATPPQTDWSGLDHLEGRSVAVVADGSVRALVSVSSGTASLAQPAGAVEIGLPYTVEVEPLPPATRNAQGAAQAVAMRLIAVTFRLADTAALRVDTGSGFREVPFKRFGPTGVLDSPVAPFTGDMEIRALGWRRGGAEPLWRVVQDAPLDCTILSVTTEMKVND